MVGVYIVIAGEANEAPLKSSQKPNYAFNILISLIATTYMQ